MHLCRQSERIHQPLDNLPAAGKDIASRGVVVFDEKTQKWVDNTSVKQLVGTGKQMLAIYTALGFKDQMKLASARETRTTCKGVQLVTENINICAMRNKNLMLGEGHGAH